jgi:enamine deaminase RidA (YjgF/YER057c/UK114 family)
VLYVGDIVKQTKRMWENVEVLLQEGGMDFNDVMHLVVYLRDTGDYEVVNELFRQRFPDIPTVISLAPVCRPTWLIEMECIAVKANNNPQYPHF